MIIIECFREFKILPSLRRSFVYGRQKPSKRVMWKASWLVLSVYRFDRQMTHAIGNLIRKNAEAIVTLDGLDSRIDKEAHEKAEQWTRNYRQQADRDHEEVVRYSKLNSELYGENVRLRRAFETLQRGPPALARGIDAQRAETGTGSVHESPTASPLGDAPKSSGEIKAQEGRA